MKIEGVFIDRDGVINEKAAEHDYVKSWEEFHFIKRAIDGLALLKTTGVPRLVVTNQRGISRKILSPVDLEDIHRNMQNVLKSGNAKVSKIYHCPHGHEDNCECRKPMPGMILDGIREYRLNPANCVMIDDDKSGIEAGYKAGCKTILVGSNENNTSGWEFKPDFIEKDLFEAAKLIVSMK